MRRRPTPQPQIRRRLLSDYRRLVEWYGHLGGHPWGRQIEALEAGEPVYVNAWELPDMARSYGLHPNDWARVDPDGTVTRVEPGCPFITAKLDGVEVAFIDDALTGRVIDDPDGVTAISRIWESIRAEARTQTESIELIERAVQRWQP